MCFATRVLFAGLRHTATLVVTESHATLEIFKTGMIVFVVYQLITYKPASEREIIITNVFKTFEIFEIV